MAQKDRVLDYLKTGRSITTFNAYNELGITRISARIFELRKEGHDIISDTLKVLNRYGEVCRIGSWSLSTNE
tara:strand:- start:4597 stop:4812 length:216 start_codon:yes stop_codon:yes gene_type:complete